VLDIYGFEDEERVVLNAFPGAARRALREHAMAVDGAAIVKLDGTSAIRTAPSAATIGGA
jgi:hypothetical protein